MARKKQGRLKALGAEVGEVFKAIFHVYRAWWVEIILLSLIIFIPIGLLDAADSQAIEAIGPGHDFQLAALIVAAFAVAATGLLGEVFLAGAIGLSLTHAEDGRPPSLGFIARRLNYFRLIAVDILFVLLVAAGFLLFIVPGVAGFVYLSLTGPVVEVEDRTIWSSFKRSFQLVRGKFWLVFWVLVPIEVVGGLVQKGIEQLCEATLGHSFLALGLGEALAEVALSPLFAIAAVLLTRKLIQLKDGRLLPGPDPRDLQRLRPTS
ncbi:MAG: hypothetical protein J0H66_04400 [Solirubrobacterales bacterium]|nr:hypothetical protein [Solirubrobacterales bacterium]OJU96312.1 MAG: hypothetical protein BGO23_02060 [Solirubrobacterales bacterium 67-14]